MLRYPHLRRNVWNTATMSTDQYIQGHQRFYQEVLEMFAMCSWQPLNTWTSQLTTKLHLNQDLLLGSGGGGQGLSLRRAHPRVATRFGLGGTTSTEQRGCYRNSWTRLGVGVGGGTTCKREVSPLGLPEAYSDAKMFSCQAMGRKGRISETRFVL